MVSFKDLKPRSPITDKKGSFGNIIGYGSWILVMLVVATGVMALWNSISGAESGQAVSDLWDEIQ